MTNTASWAVDDAAQEAVMAAQAGTAAGLATGLGDDDGLGDSRGDELGDAVAVGLAMDNGVGLGRTADPPVPQASSARSAARVTTPSLTGS
jgi:hypothetical protein